MPLPSGSSLPEEKIYPVITPDVYEVEILDIEEEVKPSNFKNKDGSSKPDEVQYKIKFGIREVGEFLDSKLMCWVRPSLQASSKSKYPTLPQLLLAVTEKTFGPDDREKVTGEFLNSLIGSHLRVTTQTEKTKSAGKEFARVTTFLALKAK